MREADRADFPVDTDFVYNQLAELVQAIRESEKLTEWFGALSQLAEPERRESVKRMAQEMTLEGEPKNMTTTLWLLAEASVFEAVKLALLEGESQD